MKLIKIEFGNNEYEEFIKKNFHKVYHTFQYKQFIESAFGCNYILYGIIDSDEIKIVLPVVPVKSLLFGNRLISTAYQEYGGFVGDENYLGELVEELKKKYGKDFDYLEIRGGGNAELTKADLYKRVVLDLDSEENVWRGIQKSKRKAIKKGKKLLEVKEVKSSEINELYSLYCKNMKKFGSPGYNKKYFLEFYNKLANKGLGKIFGSYYNGKLISALFGFCYGDRVHILIAVSDSKFQKYRHSDIMHWAFIKWACSKGYSKFDFGRVREDSGQLSFKLKWGGEVKELPSYYSLWKIKEVPHHDPHNGKFSLLVKIWRILPLWLTKIIGMPLRKKLGI